MKSSQFGFKIILFTENSLKSWSSFVSNLDTNAPVLQFQNMFLFCVFPVFLSDVQLFCYCCSVTYCCFVWLQLVKGMDPKTSSQVLIRVLAKKPGWKDTNFQVVRCTLIIFNYYNHFINLTFPLHWPVIHCLARYWNVAILYGNVPYGDVPYKV